MSLYVACVVLLVVQLSAAVDRPCITEVVVDLQSSSNVRGTVMFSQPIHSTQVAVSGHISGLGEGKHGFHIHQLGDLNDGCKAAKGHFNPFGTKHGPPSVSFPAGVDGRHVGDLGNIDVGNDGNVDVFINDDLLSLRGGNSIVGRALVIHAKEDDLGQGGDEGSTTTGNAGARVACGLLAVSKEETIAESSCQKSSASNPPKPMCMTKAKVEVKAETNKQTKGTLTLTEDVNGQVTVRGSVEGLPPGPHGFHIHQFGDVGSTCTGAAGHFNPPRNGTVPLHAAIDSRQRHVGDLGNVEAPETDDTSIEVTDPLSLVKIRDVAGRAFVIHASRDDLQSQPTGNAGGRLMCGVVGIVEEMPCDEVSSAPRGASFSLQVVLGLLCFAILCNTV